MAAAVAARWLVLSGMWEVKLEPTVMSYSTPFSACEKAGQWQPVPPPPSDAWMVKLAPASESYNNQVNECETCEMG